MIDDASAVTTEGRPFPAPAHIVERARLDAQNIGRLDNGEKHASANITHTQLSLRQYGSATLPCARAP